jgi:RNA exonuclease 1
MYQITKRKLEIVRLETKLDANNSTPSAFRDTPNTDPAKSPPLHCKFHAGQVVNRVKNWFATFAHHKLIILQIWTCCMQHVSASTPPCGGAPTHVPQSYNSNELVKLYQYHPTPELESSLRLSLSGVPRIRSAVALDCEMGTAVSGDSELIRITVIDYFTSDILLNSFVEPDVPMSHLNTQYSGVTWADIRKAKRDGLCLYGTAAARKALWRFVGPQTVVVGHGASSDLRTLRWIHNVVVDSQIVESARIKNEEEEKEAAKKIGMIEHGEYGINSKDGNVNAKPAAQGAPAIPKQKKPKGTGDLALKTLAKKLLGRDIQMKGKVGHDSLEDAVAARDVVHWQISHPQ